MLQHRTTSNSMLRFKRSWIHRPGMWRLLYTVYVSNHSNVKLAFKQQSRKQTCTVLIVFKSLSMFPWLSICEADFILTSTSDSFVKLTSPLLLHRTHLWSWHHTYFYTGLICEADITVTSTSDSFVKLTSHLLLHRTHLYENKLSRSTT